MTGLARALVATDYLTAAVAGTMAVREWRRRNAAPTSVPRALVWVGIAVWALSVVLPSHPCAAAGTLAALMLSALGLTWNTLVRSRMPRPVRTHLAVVLLAVPSVALVVLATPAAPSVIEPGGPGPIGWVAALWIYLVVVGAAGFQIAAATQAVGPHRHDVMWEAVTLVVCSTLVAAVIAAPPLRTATRVVAPLATLVLLVQWSRQDAPERRVPLQVSAAHVVDRVSDALVVLGMDGGVIDANARARAVLLDEPWSARWSLFRRPRLDAVLAGAILEDGERTVTLSTGLVVLVRVATVHELGRAVARILSARDITELERLRGRLAEVAALDPLTGLRNRRHLSAKLTALIVRARTEGCPLSLAMVDLDNLKQLNDQHGHLVGDRALVHVADALRSVRGPDDLVIRAGGDEFIVAMPGCTPAEAARRAETWRVRAAGPPADGPSLPGPLTLSVGISDWRPAMTAEELIDSADRALYAAKASGRDQVRTCNGPLPATQCLGGPR